MAMYDGTYEKKRKEPGSPPFKPAGEGRSQFGRGRHRFDEGNQTPGINGQDNDGVQNRSHQRFQRPTQRPAPNEGQPGRPMEGDPMDWNPPGGKGTRLSESKPGMGSLDDGPDQEPDSDPDDAHVGPGGTSESMVDRPDGGRFGRENTDPQEGDRLRAIQQTIRARGPEVTALVQRRRAQLGDRYRRYGNTPNGNDENAPKPRLRPGRRAFNPWPGGSYS